MNKICIRGAELDHFGREIVENKKLTCVIYVFPNFIYIPECGLYANGSPHSAGDGDANESELVLPMSP